MRKSVPKPHLLKYPGRSFGRLLPAKLTILLVLGLLAAGQASWAGDVQIYFVRKGLEYDQVAAAGPTLNPTNGYGFEAEVRMPLPNTVTSASVWAPLQAAGDLFTLSAGQTKWKLRHKYKSQAKLDSHYPTSDPLNPFVITTRGRTDGTRAVNLQLQGNEGPGAAALSNFPEVTAPNVNGYFQAQWQRATNADHIQLRVQDALGNAVFETPDFGTAGAFDGTATGVLIEPGSLAGGQTYEADVLFVKHYVLDPTGYPGALGETGFYTQTSFTITTPANLAAPDVEVYEISKGRRWVQTNSGPPAPELGTEFRFDASVKSYASNVLSQGLLLLPPTTNTTPRRNLLMTPGGRSLEFSDSASAQSALDGFYGSTNYTLAFNTARDGHKSLTLALPPTAFPPPAHVTDFEAIATVDATQPFTVSWDAWAGGTCDDFIQARIEERQNNTKVWASPDMGKQKTLHGLATNVVVPAGVLLPGGLYALTILFQRNVAQDTTSYAAALGVADVYSRTKVFLQAAGAATPPVLDLAYQAANRQFELTAGGVAGRTWRVDGSSNLFQWTPLTTNTGTTFSFSDANVANAPHCFYRVLVLP